ncbi:MAG: dTDP-glucose 4,6-dehydratase [Clostridia bacterium]|jgi:dTDP-glucose 4,6-dehydratase|nr:dTDP-glucose 4,6-dehydratase [Clostridia bacterium]
METYLITGGAGFIGSHFIRYLYNTKKEITIINVDKLTYAANLKKLENIPERENYVFICADIADQREMQRIVTLFKPDYVVNFAAESHVDRSISNAAPFIHTNIGGVYSLLQAARAGRVKRYLQISTDEVYGAREDGQAYFTEESPCVPGNPYAAGKGAADLLALSFYKTFNLPVSIIRPCNNYGIHQYPEKLIPCLIKNYCAGYPLPLYGDGLYSREWLHVEDHCRAIDCVLHQGKPGQAYNAGSGNEKTNLEIASQLLLLLQEIAPQHPSAGNECSIIFVEDRKAHDRRYGVNWDKLRRETGWVPQRSFEEGFKETVRWYLNEGAWMLKGDEEDGDSL